MIDHLSSYTTNYLISKSFYQAVFLPLGFSIQMELIAEWDKNFPNRRMCAFGEKDKPTFWLIESKEFYTPRHIAFSAKSRAAVHAFYQAGLENNGKDNGQPGLRSHYHEHYYGGFLIDPDGNNIEAVCHQPE